MKNKIIKYTLNGVILAAVATIGVAAYKIGTSPSEEKIIQEMEHTNTEEFAMLEDEMDEDENLEKYSAVETDILAEEGIDSEIDSEINHEAANETNLKVDSRSINNDYEEEDVSVIINEKDEDIDFIEEEMEETEELIDIEVPEETWEAEETSAQSILQQLHFSDVKKIQWPTQGEILLDYNMNQTIYFPTLDQYKLNPSISVQADVGTPVLAAATGMVYDVTENAQTGTTVTMELGDGYQAIYGQLKDLTVEKGEMIEQGTVIGYINTPTKYYSVEGSNLYFSMKQNGKYINPINYLEE